MVGAGPITGSIANNLIYTQSTIDRWVARLASSRVRSMGNTRQNELLLNNSFVRGLFDTPEAEAEGYRDGGKSDFLLRSPVSGLQPSVGVELTTLVI